MVLRVVEKTPPRGERVLDFGTDMFSAGHGQPLVGRKQRDSASALGAVQGDAKRRTWSTTGRCRAAWSPCVTARKLQFLDRLSAGCQSRKWRCAGLNENIFLRACLTYDDVIKHRRKEGGRGGRGGRGRGGRGGQQMFRNQMMPRGGGGGFGFPPRSPGRVMKQRMPNQGPRQNMPFRGGRGGPMPPRGFPQPQRGRGAPRGQFHPRMPMALTTNNPMNAGGRMRAWSSEVPNTRPLPVMAPPVRGRGRGGPRGIMRGRGRGMNRRMVQQQQQHFQQQQQQFQQQQQYIEPEYHQPQFQPPQPKPQMQLRQQPQRIRKPNLSQAAKVQIAQELKNSTKTARNRVRLAAQVLMQRKRQLEQLTMESAAADRQAAFKTRGVRLQGATQRVTGLRRGGGVVKRPVDARVAIRQKVVRMQKMHVPDPPQPPQPMPNRSLATAAVRRAAAFRRGGRGRGGLRGRGMRGGGAMRGQKPLTLHERFSNQTY